MHAVDPDLNMLVATSLPGMNRAPPSLPVTAAYTVHRGINQLGHRDRLDRVGVSNLQSDLGGKGAV